MSTKLNANELSAKRYAVTGEHATPDIIASMIRGEAYSAAIREVAQPIADERDELREALEDMLYYVDEGIPINDTSTPVKDAERILAKYPKP